MAQPDCGHTVAMGSNALLQVSVLFPLKVDMPPVPWQSQ